MISVIVGTNRINSRTSIIAQYYVNELRKATDEEILFYSLESLTEPFLMDNRYKPDSQSKQLTEVQDKYFIKPNKWLWVLPEYNGGLPGIFKHVIDAMSIREYSATFQDKKIALVGVSAGKAGNLRGLDYATNLLNYLKASVYSLKLPISQIESLLESDVLVDEDIKKVINQQVEGFLKF